ncbi:MAG: hypothetical protein IFK93_06415, partial [Acidobacteria bacterium]|nr:hypothetical protein [Candidatus Sulfomarinibacter kjeldsenii]
SAFDKVIARTSVMGFKDSGTPVREIGQQLGVEFVLEGSVRRSGDTVRTTVQLIEADTENHLWANSFERDFTDILALQAEVARAVANEVQLALTPEEEARLAAQRVVDPDAKEAYLRGSYHWKMLTPEGIDTAQQYFEQALEIDPSYAPAYEGLAIVWSGRAQMGLVAPDEGGAKAKAAAMKAVALDDGLAGAHEALAAVRTWTDWDWEGAWSEWRRALELNPNTASAHAYYAHFLAIMGRTKEAIPHSEKALELDPFNALFHSLYGVTLTFDRRYDDALAAFETALRLQPKNWLANNMLVDIYAALGMGAELLAGERQKIAQDPELAAAFDEGQVEVGFEEAQRRVADLLAERYQEAGGVVLPVGRAGEIAVRYLYAGDSDRAMDWVEEMHKNHNPNTPYLGLPVFDPLRSDPRFQDLLRRMNLPTK